ncbi:peroxiredoxin [Sphingomonas spermidinifaciens]|uniref:Glutathione-dependent peroxiredoxin n=1 Tax=Sphingomonas spermidinifaciens TaxID=1141889 RepID=A0A2A4B1J2_9SPHN|nr:peroxiredoxin [Sphingomonas spermidinifaciens]PCD01812.1 peroxiredoxin [Sphingomonas spermidinifaciens]
MTIKAGDRIPDTTFIKAGDAGPEPVAAADFFKGRRVALFAVPGAFTPTCSARHLPGFVERAEELKAKGIDEIACTSVNDAFVLGAWRRANDAEAVTMLADGNGEFARAAGLEMDGSAYGMGTRSQRYAMIVDDGVVEQIHVDQPGEFSVSSADHLLERL